MHFALQIKYLTLIPRFTIKVLINRSGEFWVVVEINRILVIDDDTEFVYPIKRHLKRESFIMDSTYDIEEPTKGG